MPTYFIGNSYDKNLSKDINAEFVTWNDQTEDYKIYDFLKDVLDKPSITNLVVSLCNPNYKYIGIRMALFVRIIQKLEEKPFIPIICIIDTEVKHIKEWFTREISHEKIEAFFDEQGCHFVVEKLDDNNFIGKLKENIQTAETINEVIFNNIFNKISVQSIEMGNSHHAFTNQWGVWKLAQATGNQEILLENQEFQKAYKTLYFQYLITKDKASQESVIPIIDCKNKKILLIDDDAQKGWYDVLKKIFGNTIADFQCITTKEQAAVKIASSDFVSETDIVLLDVRLTDEDRKNSTKATDFSGYQLLQKIKQENKGIQVIIFTASNKAWNMKHLVEAGAYGYYIKESPDFQYEENYAQENFDAFQKDMERAVEKASFLKGFYKHTKDLIEHTNTEYSIIGNGFINSVKLSLEYAYDTIANYHSQNPDNQKFLNYAFVSYCNLIEFVLSNLIEGTIYGSTNKHSYRLKATNTKGLTDIAVYNGTEYNTELEFIEDTPDFYKKITLQSVSNNKVKKFEDQFGGLKPLCGFAALILLRYDGLGFTEQEVKDYESLKDKRHKFMHNNKNQSDNINIQDCKDIFRMVYIVLKGVNITP